MNIGFVGEHTKGGFQRVRKVADLSPRPVDDGCVGLDQQVELARYRLDLFGVATRELFGPALADRIQLGAQGAHRPQAVANLGDDGRQKPQPQNAQHQDQRVSVNPNFTFELIEVAGHHEGVLLITAAELVRLLDAAKLGAIRVEQVEAGHAVGIAPGKLARGAA